jgi:hypothetical protein
MEEGKNPAQLLREATLALVDIQQKTQAQINQLEQLERNVQQREQKLLSLSDRFADSLSAISSEKISERILQGLVSQKELAEHVRAMQAVHQRQRSELNAAFEEYKKQLAQQQADYSQKLETNLGKVNQIILKNVPQTFSVQNRYDFRFSFSEGFKRTFLSILATILFTIMIFYFARHYLSSDTAFGEKVAKEFLKKNELLVKSKPKSGNNAPARKRKAKKVDKPLPKEEKATEEEVLEPIDEQDADSQ